jgi:transposase-like protein
VLKKIIKLLPRQPAVKEFVVDFEQGVWKAVQSLIPNATIKGCSFHWGQAIWRHVQSLGLQVKF